MTKKILYHYCSTQTFLSIINNGSVFLSALTLSNDESEGKILANTFERLFVRDGLGVEAIDQLRSAFSQIEDQFYGLGFCLSEAGDLLSQWRGYADDGSGVSIGFSASYLETLAKNSGPPKSGFSLRKVLYKEKEHEESVEKIYAEIKSILESGKSKKPRPLGLMDTRSKDEYSRQYSEYIEANIDVHLKLLGAFGRLFALKSDAFSEEREWRLISFITKGSDPDGLFDDVDANCQFRAYGNRLIPYRKYDLDVCDVSPIVEVVLGPKNITPEHVVRWFLQSKKFEGVRVVRSRASYR